MLKEFSGDFLQWLRGFYAVAKSGSITGATREMGRNQPTISHQIKCLEEELGVSLFDRSRGRMALTEEGEQVFRQVAMIFEQIEHLMATAKSDGDAVGGEVRIATTHAVLHYFLPKHLGEFSRRCPLVKFDLMGGGLELIHKRLEAAEADFGIVCSGDLPGNFKYKKLFTTKSVLVARKESRLGGLLPLSLKKISQLPFISFPQTSSIAKIIHETFAANGLSLNPVLTLNNFELVKQYVLMDLGVAILDDFALTHADRERFAIHPLDKWFTERNYDVVMLHNKYLSPAVRLFLDTLKPKPTPRGPDISR